ncbi:MAG: YdeI/OmpD-associated family protein [Chloroflexota bacterium]|nr:YdeI/OmpD-associated family protein [Chloroflexota bacterium]
MEATIFPTAAAFRAWLEENHVTAPELWVGYYRKGSGKQSISYSEAVDEALCFGWIDGITRRIDETSWANRYTPRRARSIWSNVNVRRVELLLEQGRMRAAGIAAFEARRADRTGIYAFEQAPAVLDPALAARLRADALASAFVEAQPAGYRQSVIHWVMEGKQEATRLRRLEKLIEDSAAGRRVGQFSRPARSPEKRMPPLSFRQRRHRRSSG